jgi:PAS domain S-box-containing protein
VPELPQNRTDAGGEDHGSRISPASELDFRFLAETIPQLVWTTTADGWHDYFNSHWFAYTGMTLEETQGWGWSHLLHPDDREETLRRWTRSLATGEPYDIEYRFRRAQDGSYRWFLGRALPLRDGEGRVVRWFGTCTDIQDQKETEVQREALLRQARRQAEREALLNRIGQAQRAEDEPEDAQALAVAELGRLLGADRCYYTAYDLAHDRATVSRDWRRDGLPSVAGQYRVSAFGIDPEAVFADRSTTVMRDVRTDRGTATTAAVSLEALGVRSGITVPLYNSDGSLTAALSVAASEPRDWTDDEVSLVEAVAAQTRTTMELALLSRRERNIAERLQDALRPALPGRIPGLDLDEYYRPALDEASVGGDFFDVFSLDKGCVALVVGDLSGKGLAAASEVATVRNMLRFTLYRGRTLAEALSELNDALTEHDLLTGFATVFAGVYDRAERTLTYVSCGHEPALVRRDHSGEVDLLMPTAPVLGAFAGVPVESAETTLGPNDALVIFTDGVSDAGRSRGPEFGVEGVAAVLRDETARVAARPGPDRATHMAQCIVDAVNAYTSGRFEDDACILVAMPSDAPR